MCLLWLWALPLFPLGMDEAIRVLQWTGCSPNDEWEWLMTLERSPSTSACLHTEHFGAGLGTSREAAP